MNCVDSIMGFEEEEPLPPIKLIDGINVKNFIDTSVTTFGVNMKHAEEQEECHTYFNKEELLQCVNLDCLDIGSDEEDEKQELGTTPFQKIAKKMKNLTEDGKVKKRLMQSGSGPVVPEKAFVTVNYNAYVEYGDEPYDSSWLRGHPLFCHLQEGTIILGLDVAIASMKKGETSRFLIHPDMAYGKLGCPPRIPHNAELLFEVELVNFTDNAAAESLAALSPEELKKADFNMILKTAQAEHLTGNEMFKRDHVSSAIHKYRKAVNLLEKCHLKDENDELKYKKFVLKLYINLAVCYNKQKSPRQACVMCRNALDIDPRNAKALFNFGRALIMLSEFDQARHRLIAAQKLEPGNKDITEELKKLDKKQRIYESDAKNFSQRVFEAPLKKCIPEPKPEKAVVSEDFEKSATTYLTDFVNSEKTQMPLPIGLTAQEELCVRNIAVDLGLSVRSQERKGEKWTYIFKSNID